MRIRNDNLSLAAPGWTARGPLAPDGIPSAGVGRPRMRVLCPQGCFSTLDILPPRGPLVEPRQEIVTTTALLNALHDPADQRAWTDLHSRFRPVIEACARALGLNDNEAEEAGQRTFAEVARSYRAGNYQRRRGRLRSWILGITRHMAMDVLRERGRPHRGDSAIHGLSDDEVLTRVWKIELERQILRDAIAALRDDTSIEDRTIRAFELHVLQGVPAEETARQFGMTTHDVYVVKHRIAGRLREIVVRIQAAYEEDG